MTPPPDDGARHRSPPAAVVIQPIAVVENGEHDPARADWSRVRSRIRLLPAAVPGDAPGDAARRLAGLDGYSHVWVVGWLDRMPEDLRRRPATRPQGDRALPEQGALALRGARPNPISLTACRLRAVRGDTLEVEGLDLLDGTPVLDLKPYVAFYDAPRGATIPRWAGGP